LTNFKRRFLLFLGITLCVTVFSIMSPDNAKASDNQEQVVVSPAQQAVNSALSNATTEVQQATTATNNAIVEITQAQTEYSQAQSVTTEVTSKISLASAEINNVQTAINTINNVDLSTTLIDQSSQVVQDAKDTVAVATTAINNVATQITEAQTAISEVITAKTEASTAQSTAQTELTQANLAIDAAQTAVNNLQATIGTTVNVLAGVDDAGVQMNLPFGMQMGGTVYNNVFVGSNATITFGNNEGHVYWDTPGAPSVSIAGWDWTTWSTGTGITYSTTGTSLDVAWDLRPFPQQDASTQMVQIRFNADVNPNDGAWMANVTAVGPIPNGARFNYRETTNGAITPITDTNSGTGFSGQIGQGSAFTPYVDPNTSTVQAAVDAANATITQLNQSLSPVVAQNTTNTSNINAINTASLTNTVNSAVSTKTSLQSTLNTKAGQLISAINNNIPTPAPVLAEPIIAGTTVTITPELPAGYTANTWFYQVVTEDPSAENPYEGQTLNTDGAPASIELSGLTEGATYTVRVANWSGPVSQYTDTIISIPVTQSANLNGGGAIQPPPPPAEEPPMVEPESPVVVEEPPAVEPEPPVVEEPPIVVEEPPAVEPEPPAIEELPPLTVEEIISVVEDLVADGNLTAADAEAVLDALMSDGEITSSEITTLTDNLISDGTLSSNESALVLDALNSDGVVTNSEVTSLVEALVSEGGLSTNEAELIVDALSADGDITTSEVNNLSDALTQDGSFTLAEKDLVSEVLITAAEGAPVTAANIEAAGLEYRDLPPTIPVEVREDVNGNPVVIQAEVASALLVLESPAALANAIATCFNPDEAIEGLTEEQKCELGKALLSMGADMSIPEREKAEDIVVVTIIAGQIVLGSAYRRKV
jgi:polyhydroxyalkanoate synthesis regulator phasin